MRGNARGRVGAVAIVVAGLLFSASVSAQARYPWEDYDKRIQASQAVAPLGPDLLGDSVSLANGALSFTTTDVSLPGNHALPVAFTRTYAVTDRKDTRTDEMLADWSVDLPSISGTFAPDWITQSSTTNRCSDTQAPPMPSSAHFLTEFWHGIHLNLPGRGSQELLVTNPGDPGGGDPGDGGGGDTGGPGGPGGPGGDDPQRIQLGGTSTMSLTAVPTPTDGPTYRWATNTHIQVACLPSIQNGTGEGFLAITPDGTRYWFDWMAQTFVPTLESPVAVQGIHMTTLTPRRRNVLYATRVEDRFGNWVTYDYSNAWNAPGKLTRIASSDGRQITVAYGGNGHIASVSDGSRTWQYTYAAANAGRVTLSRVTRPDNSRWTIDFAGFTNAEIQNHEVFAPGEIYRTCTMLETPINYDAHPVGSLTHPSGATGTFTVGIQEHGRSNVPVSCGNVTTDLPQWGNNPNDDINTYVISYNAFTLEQKTLTGPGLAPLTWTYSYAPGISKHFYPGTTPQWPVCMEAQCSQPPCLADSCAGASHTTVVGPDNTWTRYKYGNSFLYNEGKLLRVDRGSSATDILRTTVNTYDLSQADQAYPARFGDSIQVNGQGFTAEFHRPLTQTQVTQQGATFTHGIDSFDVLARPLTETRASSLGYSRTEATAWHDDLDDWVIGQVASLTCTNATPASVACDGNDVIAETTYGPLALPTRRDAFGKLQHTLTYNADGTLHTYRDGRNNTTTLSSWYRGVPRLIQYPDGTSTSATVNPIGTLASTTGEAGHKTCYAYDVMGRLAQVTYPSETQPGVCDNSRWNPTTQAFVQVGAAEYGLGAGHWRQTVTTGNGVKVQYFDALWRPRVVREYDAANVAGTQRFTRLAYDHGGRTTFASYPGTSDALTQGTHTSYDALGRIDWMKQDSELGVLTTDHAYSSTSFATTVTNPRGNQTTTTFQGWDEPVTDFPVRIAQPEGAVTDIVRDPFGKPLAITRGNAAGTVNLTRHAVYDTTQALCKTIEPETGATVFQYDLAGNVAWSASGQPLADPARCGRADVPLAEQVHRTYDARNRLLTLRFPDGLGDQDWVYTPDGLPGQITTWNGAGYTIPVINAFSYNARRMLDGQGENISQPGWYTWALGYGYDRNGHQASLVLPSNLVVDYAPNALGQATKAGAFASNVSYHPNGAIKHFTYGNGIVHTTTLNARGLPARIMDEDPATASRVLDDTLYYDPNANLLAITDGATGRNQRGNRDMAYDGLDRLVSTVSPMFGAASYGYDVLDNLTRVGVTGGPNPRDHWYEYDGSNRLTNVHSGSNSGPTVIGLGYDVRGNVTNKNGKTFHFTHGNRLEWALGVEGYRYDGLGHRVLAWALSTRNNVLSQYSKDGRLAYQHDERRGVAVDHIYLGDRLIAQRERNIAGYHVLGVRYLHTDGLGSVAVETDASRMVAQRSEYEPYGDLLNRNNDNRPGYTGHVMDAETGLTYMQQRYYDPGIGMFLSVDPVTAYGSGDMRYFNRYAYAANNPYKFTDPDGRALDTAVDAGFIIYDSGRFLGAAAATIVGAATGNAALQSAGMEGMRDTGVDLGASIASAVVPGLAAPVARGALKTADELMDAAGGATKGRNVVAPGGREAAKKLFREADIAGKGRRTIQRDETGGGRQVVGRTADGKSLTIRFKPDGTTRIQSEGKKGKIIFPKEPKIK